MLANTTSITAPSGSQLQHRYNVRIFGQGTQTLLFCNGLGCSQEVWQYLTPRLGTRYQLVMFDYPGAGEAQRDAYDPHRHNSLHGYAQDVVDICHALALQPVVLVGHSVGASIALLVGSQNPATLGEQLTTYFCQADPVITRSFARLTFFSDIRPDVARVRVRTLILQCQHDVAAPQEVGAYLLQQLPRGVLVIMQATGHCPHLSAPLETLAAIEAFLA